MIEYREVGAGSPGVPLLFLHGLGGDASNWEPQLEGLGQTRHCVAWTLPGYGDSTPLELMSFPALATAAVELLDQLECERACVVGLSMGGYIAQQLALDHPDRVERLVLAGTTNAFGKPGSSFNAEFLASRLAPLDQGATPASMAERVVDGLVGPAPHPGTRANTVASMQRISPEAYRQALSALVTWDIRDRCSEITQPALCLAGADDSTAPVRAMERLVEGLGNATLTVIPECGHLMNLERPAEFNAAVRSFVASNGA